MSSPPEAWSGLPILQFQVGEVNSAKLYTK